MADALGSLMLRDCELAGRLWIVEGVPDFLTAATMLKGRAPEDAVLGIISGSWTQQFAARVPDGAHVAIAVHHDKAGEAYTERIAASLAGRVQLERWTPEGGAAA
jgi:hypothetical protein